MNGKDDKEYPEPNMPECGGYYCDEEHGHIDCKNVYKGRWHCYACGRFIGRGQLYCFDCGRRHSRDD